VRASGVVIAHNRVGDRDDPSTRDVLAQVAWVGGGLDRLGVPWTVLPVGEDRDVDEIARRPGVAVVNLVESPPGSPSFQVDAAEAFARFGLPFTGSAADAIRLTTDKLATRSLLDGRGIPVAPGGLLDPENPSILDRTPPPWILKPALEDASVGLDAGAVTDDPRAASERARELTARLRQPVLVEHLLDGREFNVSLIAGSGDVEVLPLAEMLFVDFPANLPKVVDWAAKWDEDSFVARHTVRRFLSREDDNGLAERLRSTAQAAWEACGVAGYARVDMRLDDAGTPCVLEVNANPCLSADGGFVAAAAEGGLDGATVVRRLLAAAGVET